MEVTRFITARQREIHESFLRTQSMSDTARELGISQIRVREALVQVQRNLIRGAGDQPPTLKAMQRGDVTTRFNVSRDLRNGRPAKHQPVVGGKVETGASGPRSPQIEVIGSTGPRRIIVTGLNGRDAPHAGFVRNLRAYAAHLDAELRLYIVGSQSPGAGVPRDVRDLVRHEQVTIGDRIDIRPDLGLPRYSRFPLEGLQRVAPGRSAVVIHATPQLESLPRISAHPPRIQMTSGLASPSGRIVGNRVTDQPEQMGAAVIEIGDRGDVHARRISAMPEREGDFHDLDMHVSGGKVGTRRRVEAIAFGDIHHPLTDPDVIAATWGPGGLVDKLRPRHQVLHDLADFHARNHHDARDHHARFRRFVACRDDVRAELEGVSAFAACTRRPGCTTHVISSNHDRALTRWLRDSDHKADPRNAEFYLECERIAYANLRDGRSADIMPEILRSFATDRLDGVEFIEDGQSLMLAGVEHAVHGDRGPDGRRGSVAQFESMGIDMTVGHFHSPAIRGGIYVAGLCSSRLGYELGPTTGAIAHVITHADGARQHVVWEAGRYHA